jgi:hypothetical protein
LRVSRRTDHALVGLTSAAIGVLAIAGLVSYGLINPLCCADDASFAVVAKNFASGHGYLLTLKYFGPDFSGSLFDPELGTGPSSIIPVALAILVFGPMAWVPGITHVAMSVALFVAALLAMRSSQISPALMTIAFVLLATATSAFHFEQWYSQLGEVLAALLLCLGVAFWAKNGRGASASALLGFCFGLAILSKHIAVLYISGPLLFFALQLATGRLLEAPRKECLKDLAVFLVGTAVPVVLFELWKVGVLGFPGWLSNWKQFIAFIQYQSGSPREVAMSELFFSRVEVVFERFAIGWVPFLFLVGGLLSFVWRFCRRADGRLALVLLVGFFVHACYWIVGSNGWPRYLFIGVVVLCFVVAVCVSSVQVPLRLRLYVAAAALPILIVGLPRIESAVEAFRGAVRNQHVTAAKEIVRVIHEARPGAPVLTQWWAHVAALEYLSTERGGFRGYSGVQIQDTDLVVVDSRYLNQQDRRFTRVLTQCSRKLAEHGPYRLFACS